jgi:hypothetical protein
MAKKGRGNSAWDNGFDRNGEGAYEYFEDKVGFALKEKIYDENSDQFRRSTMREDKQKAIYANTLFAEIGRSVQKFIYHRDGNRDDAYEVLLSQVSERAFRNYALEKYHLIDPLNPPTDGSTLK